MKNTTSLMIIVVLLALVSCKSSYTKIGDKNANYIPYYLKVYEADSLFIVGNYQRSYEILDSLFKKYEPLCTDNYGEYSIYLGSAVRSGNTKNIDKKVKYGFLKFGGIGPIHKEGAEIYEELVKKANINDEEINKLSEEYYATIDLDLRKQLVQMYNEDQRARELEDFNEIKFIDETNRKELEVIFNKYGYPGNNLIGAGYGFTEHVGMQTLLLHLDRKFKKKYFSFLLKNVQNGKCSPTIYTTVYDRFLMDSLQMQYFGSFDCNYGKCKMLNGKKIDSIRASVGLPKLNYYEWKIAQLR